MAYEVDLFVQMHALGLCTWTEYEKMDPDLAKAILASHERLVERVNKVRAREAERQKRINELDRRAAELSSRLP